MRKRTKVVWLVVGVAVAAAIVIAALRPETWVTLSRGWNWNKQVYTRDPDDLRKTEQRALETYMNEELDRARRDGKSDEEIAQIRARFRASIEALDKKD